MSAWWLDVDEGGGSRAIVIAAGLAALAAEGAHGLIDPELEIAGRIVLGLITLTLFVTCVWRARSFESHLALLYGLALWQAGRVSSVMLRAHLLGDSLALALGVSGYQALTVVALVGLTTLSPAAAGRGLPGLWRLVGGGLQWASLAGLAAFGLGVLVAVLQPAFWTNPDAARTWPLSTGVLLGVVGVGFGPFWLTWVAARSANRTAWWYTVWGAGLGAASLLGLFGVVWALPALALGCLLNWQAHRLD
jgi:hypothetical protein